MLVGIHGAQINVIDEGAGDPVVMLHGLGLAAEMWLPQIEEFSGERRCVALDHRGHGRSDRTYGPYTIAGLAEDAEAVIEALGLGRVHLVGLSMGGMVAQELVLRHPERVRTLAILDSLADAGEMGAQMDMVAPMALAQGLAAVSAGFEAMTLAPSTVTGRPQVVKAFGDMFRATDPVCFVRAIGAIAAFSALDRLGAVSVPAAVIWGEPANLTPRHMAEAMATAIPGCDLHVIPDAGHMSNMENPSEVNAVLAALWKRA
jgi:pimeloyl-ACP methyl ester carboxylesterase